MTKPTDTGPKCIPGERGGFEVVPQIAPIPSDGVFEFMPAANETYLLSPQI